MKSSPERPSRRDVLKGAATMAAAKVTSGFPALAQTPDVLPQDLAYLDLLSLDPDALHKFQTAPTPDDVASITRALSVRERQWTKDIENNKTALHAGAREILDDKGELIGNSTILRIRDYNRPDNPYRFVEVTAWHVVTHLSTEEQKKWRRHPKRLDIAVREVAKPAASDHGALHLGTAPGKRGEDVTRKVGIVLGIDDDIGKRVRKAYPSRISPRLSQKVLEVMRVHTSFSTQGNAFRMIVLPDKEAAELSSGSVPAQGMSGSAILFVPEGGKGVEFAGVIVSVVEQTIGGKKYSLAFIIDHTDVREAIDHLFAGGR